MYVSHKNIYNGLSYQQTKDANLDYHESTTQKKKGKKNDDDDDVLINDTKNDRSLIRGTKEQQEVDTDNNKKNHHHGNKEESLEDNNEPIDNTKYQDFVKNFDVNEKTASKKETKTDVFKPSITKNDEILWHDEKLSKLVGNHEFILQNEKEQKEQSSTTRARRTSPNSPTSTRLKLWPGVPLKGEILEIQKKYRKIANYDSIQTEPHNSASLHCDIYGGPSREGNDEELEVVYWEDIPMDAAYQSPFYEEKPLFQPYDDDDVIQPYDSESTKERKAQRIATQNKRHSKTKYITFEPDDNDGWNNKRMNFETMVVLSHAMGRTLVLPPKSRFYNTPKSGKTLFSFDDIYHLETLNRENKGINIITMEEFLRREAVEGKLVYTEGVNKGSILYPPENQTNWDNIEYASSHNNRLNEYLREVGHSPDWQSLECVVAFPSFSGGNPNLEKIMSDTLRSRDGRPFPDPLQFQGKPVPVNYPGIERFREMIGGRRELCVYDDAMKQTTLLHFQLNTNSGIRSFPHFYSFLFFEDWRQDTWVKRFVRDNLRYNDEVQCAASRVIDLLRQEKNPNIGKLKSHDRGVFDAIHVHRGDLDTLPHGDKMLLPAEEIVKVIQSKVADTKNSTLYISTDVENLSFFDPLKDVYKNVYFLKDIIPLIKGVDRNHLGMIEQIVASRSQNFWGTHTSSFTGYIVRLRGYYSIKEKWEGYREGKLIRTYYLAPKEVQNEMRIYQAVRMPFCHREFPVAWKDINKGTGEMKWEGW